MTPYKSHETKGTLEVICGPMFSGKSEELIRRIKRAQYAKLSIAVFKHQFDNRTTIEHIASHDGSRVPGTPIDHPAKMLDVIPASTKVIAIDEVQFFPIEMVNVVCKLVDEGKRVIVAGLDLDFKRRPFGCMPILLAIADHVTKLKAICMDCGCEAHFTQRLVDGKPAQYNDPLVVIGAQENYQARCRDCHSIDEQPPY
ncbi:MAG TPA: thymidine kinase [Candidatus Babeliales bacterium]|nr:thymidine kinase [Candidatus Babeliales bacterium]